MRWLLGAVFLLLSTLASVWVTRLVLVRLPPDYLVSAPASATRAQWVGRNLAALVLVVVGVLLSLPGVPGQGLLTIAVGLLLADVPGKQRLERRLLGRPSLLAALNGVRARAGVPPLTPPTPSPAADVDANGAPGAKGARGS